MCTLVRFPLGTVDTVGELRATIEDEVTLKGFYEGPEDVDVDAGACLCVVDVATTLTRAGRRFTYDTGMDEYCVEPYYPSASRA